MAEFFISVPHQIFVICVSDIIFGICHSYKNMIPFHHNVIVLTSNKPHYPSVQKAYKC